MTLRGKLDPFCAALLLSGFVLYAFYVSYTKPLVRNPDAWAHLQYVQFLVERQALPRATDCSVCHHPPLYYLAAAGIYRGGQAVGAPPERVVQLFSLALMGVFTVASALSLQRLLPRPYQQRLALALVVFWPATVMAAARINNDVAYYAVAAVTLHALVRWWQEPSARRLLLAAGLAALGLFVKANALAMVILLLAVVTLRWARAEDRRAFGRAVLVPVGALVLVAALHGLVRGSPGAPLAGRVLGTAYKTAPTEIEPRGLAYYVGFKPGSFVEVPYVEAVSFKKSAEPTFWNHWLKSSLFGTRNFRFAFLIAREPEQAKVLARSMNGILLALLGFGLVGGVLAQRYATAVTTLLFTCVAVFAGLGLGFHWLVPTAHHADFRFVYPMLVPAAALFADVTAGLRRRGLWLWHGGYLLALNLVAFSIWYFVVLRG